MFNKHVCITLLNCIFTRKQIDKLGRKTSMIAIVFYSCTFVIIL